MAMFFNQAEYTDGILAVGMGGEAQTFWPPLYAWLSHMYWFISTDAGMIEMGAKYISLFASSLTVIPIYYAARSIERANTSPDRSSIFGSPAAIWACVWFLVSPMALRWGTRMMTDALFTALFFSAVWAMVDAWKQRCSGLARYDQRLALATFFTVAAIMTRYQGVLLVPPLVIAILAVRSDGLKRGNGPLPRAAYAQLFWLVPIVWFAMNVDQFTAHAGQVSARTTLDGWTTALAYWTTFESFVLLSPYFFTYPIFALAVWGAIVSRDRLWLWLFAYFALALLVMQSVFQSFQSRYLLPLLPFIVVWAGVGGVDLYSRRLPLMWRQLLYLSSAPAIAYCIAMSVAVTVGQAGVFGDVKDAGRLMSRSKYESAIVYSNERYGPQSIPIKMRFWSERDVLHWSGQPLNAGDILCLHNFVGQQAYTAAAGHLQQNYDFVVVQRFTETVWPILPDVMATDMSLNGGPPFSPQQQPLAWPLRYTPQHFETTVIKIVGRK